jgi:superfamily II RNA helicase
MVKQCSNVYNSENDAIYAKHFDKYNYPLHSFQKYSIEAIVEGHHVLVTAPTGSGKTLPGEFAIEYFVAQGKRVIYTTPIKALSNQKFYDFTLKYPHISFGILTGDLKCNPDAQCLIMTTEILLNKLYQVNSNSDMSAFNISFEMDIAKELGCVVFDEVHYINDAHRGHVWEQCIMMIPMHVQMVMLSATIDKPEEFAKWVETRRSTPCLENVSFSKIVYIASNSKRAVPLTHYAFLTVTNSIFKAIKDKALQEEIRVMINKPMVVQTAEGIFQEVNYFKMHKMLKLFEKNNVYVKRTHVLNQVTKYLFDNEMLPALCFVFSRKQLEVCAKEVTTVLLEDDSKVPYIVRRECEQIIRKLPNYKEYLELPEYIEMVALLEKGVGMHHAGILAPLREMVEILYSKGYIKLLFCTETLSIGINMPVKTAIFTGVEKFDGSNSRIMYSHEYTQAAGRAGRLGLDKVGHVIHLNNLFKNIDSVQYKQMMSGVPQTLVSKFKISYNLILNLIDIGNNNIDTFTDQSLIQEELVKQGRQIQEQLTVIDVEIAKLDDILKKATTPFTVLEEYDECCQMKHLVNNKRRKEMEQKIISFSDDYKTLLADSLRWKKWKEKKEERLRVQQEYEGTKEYLAGHVTTIFSFLQREWFILNQGSEPAKLSLKGMIATSLREVQCLAFATLIEERKLTKLTPIQLVMVFSCFTNIVVRDELKTVKISAQEDKDVQNVISDIRERYDYYDDFEDANHTCTGVEYDMHYDLVPYVRQWCNAENDAECKHILQTMSKEKEIFLGEFVKALLKINNIASEMDKISEKIGEVEFQNNLRKISDLTLKYVATNQSLYV